MTYFYILFILLFLSSLLFRDNKRLGIFLLLFMTFMCAFRGMNVGTDTASYWNNDFAHDFALDSKSSYDAEFLFVLWTNTITNFNLNPRLCLFSLSIITLLFLLLSVKRFRLSNKVSYVHVAFYFYILGFYAMSFNIARQIAASTIVLYAYSFLPKENKKRYLFFVFILLASSIHISSIIFTPFYFVRKLKFGWFSKHIYVTIIVMAVFYIVVQLYKGTMMSSLFSHLSIFSYYEKYAEKTMQSDVSIVGFVFAIAEIILFLLCFKRLSKSGSNILASLLFLSVIITIILSAFYGNIYRLRIGLTIVEPMAVATAFSQTSKLKGQDIVLFLAITLVFGYEALSSLSRGAYDIIPYYFSF